MQIKVFCSLFSCLFYVIIMIAASALRRCHFLQIYRLWCPHDKIQRQQITPVKKDANANKYEMPYWSQRTPFVGFVYKTQHNTKFISMNANRLFSFMPIKCAHIDTLNFLLKSYRPSSQPTHNWISLKLLTNFKISMVFHFAFAAHKNELSSKCIV